MVTLFQTRIHPIRSNVDRSFEIRWALLAEEMVHSGQVYCRRKPLVNRETDFLRPDGTAIGLILTSFFDRKSEKVASS